MNILSICGGGVRGLMPLEILKTIETKYGKNICNVFDYYAGSSIGALIIAGLLISDDGKNPKYTCDELYKLIEELCKKVFSNTLYHRMTTAYGWLGAKYSVEYFEEILKKFFGDRKMLELLKPVCFPSFDDVNHKPIYFTKDKYGDVLIRDVIRAVTAAPTFFDPKEIEINGIKLLCCDTCEINGKYKLHDSGLVVNNPCLIGQLYATSEMKIIDKTNMFHLCLGTGFSKTQKPTNGGVWGWLGSILGYIFAGSNENQIEGLLLSLIKENVFVVNVEIDGKYDTLDNASDEYIKYYNDKIKKWIEDNNELFFDYMNKIIKCD